MLGLLLLYSQGDLLIEIVQDRVINHVLAFLAEHDAKLCINTCARSEGAEQIMRTSRRTESVFFVVQMLDDMVVLPAG